MPRNRRRVCFVTGTRAEFGLMERTLRAIAAHPRLALQIVVTGMHLDARRGSTAKQIAMQGWKVDRITSWKTGSNPSETAVATGKAMAALARIFCKLRSEIVLVVGDRVEAFAAASAAHVSGLLVAHVHGGDRAAGQVDDSLRHAITKLAHVHFPATEASARRIVRLGEDRSRVHRVGSPGVEGIREAARTRNRNAQGRGRFGLIVLHPVDADPELEHRRALLVLRAVERARLDRIEIVYPNNDPGSDGIIRAWEERSGDRAIILHPNLARDSFLALMRDAAMLVGNSSSGIIEAASFGTPVVDIGPRQSGRERNANVVHADYSPGDIERAIREIVREPRRRMRIRNVYEGRATSRRIADLLSQTPLDAGFRRKLIAY